MRDPLEPEKTGRMRLPGERITARIVYGIGTVARPEASLGSAFAAARYAALAHPAKAGYSRPASVTAEPGLRSPPCEDLTL